MQLNVYDMDNTLIDTAEVMMQCQLEGLLKATADRKLIMERSKLYLSQILRVNGIEHTLSVLGIDQDTFFKKHYKTFDPKQAVYTGKMRMFDDAFLFFDKGARSDRHLPDRKTFAIDAIISNSSIDATQEKLYALNTRHYFEYVLAEFEKDKAKPKPYMAMQLLEQLEYAKTINKIDKIINVGDKKTDIEFGEVLYDTLATKMNHKPAFNNYLIDRNKMYRWMEPIKNAQIITSFMEI